MISYQKLVEAISNLAVTMGDALQLRGFKAGGTPGQVPVRGSGPDFTWDWMDASAGGATVTNLFFSRDATTLTVISDTGSDAILPGATVSLSGMMIASDKAKLDAITGTNTGDETAATIKSKLGITVLSGSNTGDQDLSGYEVLANKSTSVVTDQASNVKYPTVKSIYDWATSIFVQLGGALGTPSSGNGSNLTALNGTQITTGTVADARIASALTGKTYSGVTLSSSASPTPTAGSTLSWDTVAHVWKYGNTSTTQTVASVAYVDDSVLFAGAYTLPSITDNGDGSVTLGSGEYIFAADSDGSSPFTRHTIIGATYSLNDNALNFVLANFNAGVPFIQVLTSNATVDNLTVFPLFVITRSGTQLDIVDLDHESKGLPNKIALRLARTRRIEPEQGGLIISTAATRLVTVTAGRVWYSATHGTLAAFNSSTDTLIQYAHVAGVWTPSTVTQFSNTQYDDGTNLQTLSNGRYAVAFVYRAVAENATLCYVLLGTGNFTLGQAQVATPPASLPLPVINSLFVGRIITLKNASAATQVDSAFTTIFAVSGVTDHESLSGLLGGAASDHNHLTTAQHTVLTSIAGVSYADLTAANAALPAGRIFYNQALGYLDTTTA